MTGLPGHSFLTCVYVEDPNPLHRKWFPTFYSLPCLLPLSSKHTVNNSHKQRNSWVTLSRPRLTRGVSVYSDPPLKTWERSSLLGSRYLRTSLQILRPSKILNETHPSNLVLVLQSYLRKNTESGHLISE